MPSTAHSSRSHELVELVEPESSATDSGGKGKPMANQTIIQAITPALKALVAQGEALAGLNHEGVKGYLREALIKLMIEPFLPLSVSVLTGTIVCVTGERKERNEDDLVIFSRDRVPLLLNLGKALIPLEGVLAQIEVKSELKRSDVVKAAKSAIELQRLALPVHGSPAGLIFAYKSDNSVQSEASRLLDVLANEVRYQPGTGFTTSPIQAICIATRGTWMLTELHAQSGWWFVPPDNEKHLLAFASLISNTMYQSAPDRFGVGRY
jgi:hypothetical protein